MVSPQPRLVTLATAKKHLKIVNDDENDDVELKLELATGIILDYLDRSDDDWTEAMLAWTTSTVPAPVKAAILVQLAELYRFRGDDDKLPEREQGHLSPMVKAYLARYRDPAIA